MPDATEHPNDLHHFQVAAADGPLGTVSEVGAKHLTVRIRHGLGRHDDLLVPQILVEEIDPDNKRVRLSVSRPEILHMHGAESEGLGAWFGGINTSAQQPFGAHTARPRRRTGRETLGPKREPPQVI